MNEIMSELDDKINNAITQVENERKTKTIYPPRELVLRCFYDTPSPRVVILGQDVYHRPNQANGLAFSVNKNVRVPPSLRNIYKEIGISPSHGDLSSWAQQGVLLMNCSLTVEHGKPASHVKIWEKITDEIISRLCACECLVFMLWGNYARKKKQLIHGDHLVLEAIHPSPLARNGFKNCDHFNKCNAYLKQNSFPPIDWVIT